MQWLKQKCWLLLRKNYINGFICFTCIHDEQQKTKRKKTKEDYFLDYLCYSVLPVFHSLFSILTPSWWPHLISHCLNLLLNKSVILPTFTTSLSHCFCNKGSVFLSTKGLSSLCAPKPLPLTLHTTLLFNFFSPSFLWKLCHYNSIFSYLQPLCKREAKEKKMQNIQFHTISNYLALSLTSPRANLPRRLVCTAISNFMCLVILWSNQIWSCPYYCIKKCICQGHQFC